MASACSYQVPLSLLQLLKLNSLSGRSKKRGGGGRRKKSALLRMLEAHLRIRETIPRRIRKNTKISKRLVNTVFSTFGLPRFHNAAQCCDNFIQIRLQDSRFFFLKISKEIVGRGVCVLRTRSSRASHAQTFCLTALAYLNTQKYGLFCSLHPNYQFTQKQA